MKSRIRITTPGGVLLVEPIRPLEELEQAATAEEMRSIESFTSPKRRAERLAWRQLLRKEVESAQIEYLQSGAPIIRNSQFRHISVSHCSDCVAVALSTGPCGVDIERTNRNFARVAERYITSEEQALLATYHTTVELQLAIGWCAKECAYKMADCQGIDFIRDLRIIAADADSLRLQLHDNPPQQLSILLIDELHTLVYRI